MTATTCAWCTAYSAMAWRGEKALSLIKVDGEVREAQAPFRCEQCGRLSIGTVPYDLDGFRYAIGPTDPEWWAECENDIDWTPATVGGKKFPDVPEHIGSAADEAYRCCSIGAYRAAIMLARAVIEATAKDHGIVQGVLAAKIDAMAAKGVVREYTKVAAHEIRYLGNDMAHGDFIEATDAEDAGAVLVVLSAILDEVYQGPARVAAMKARRTNRPTKP